MTSPGTQPGDIGRPQKRMGPAPFASFEDLSDELESPEDKNVAGSVVRLPGIREDLTPTTPSIAERAPSPAFVCTGISLVGAINTNPSPITPVMSSLSLQTKPNIKPNTPRIDISRASSSSHHDSRDSSPEREIFDSKDPNNLRSSTEELDFQDLNDIKKAKNRPQSPVIPDDPNIRKDSQCSDIILLSISGRTSRLSSIGSQGSGQSRLSNASHLSVISGQSGLSRSSSPHKMVLETSFCGTKPPEVAKADVGQPGTKVEAEVMEKLLLSRKHDPTEAILAEGISVEMTEKASKVPPEKPIRKSDVRVECVKSDITIKVDKPVSQSNNTNTEKVPKEPKYIRIKLKPDHCYDDEVPGKEIRKPDSLELDSIQSIEPTFEKQSLRKELIPLARPEPIKSTSVTPSGSPKLPRSAVAVDSNIESVTPSPSVSRRSSFASLFRSKEAILSPESPSVPGHKRKNTLTGVLREAGDNLRTRSRSRSKSRDRDSHKSSLSTAPSSTESIDSKSKHKSVLSLFKSKKDKIKSESENSSQETLPSIEEAASIRIPLHSPTYYENRSISQDWKTSSQDSQETVIEATSKKVNVTVEPAPKKEEVHINKNNFSNKSRQSSTSSENVVFSTKLGNDNEVFTTKLPKQLPKEPGVKKIELNAVPKSETACKKDTFPTKVDSKENYSEDKRTTEIVTKKFPVSKSVSENRENEIKKVGNDILKEKRISQLSTGALSSVSSLVSSANEDDRNSSESEKDSEDILKNKRDRDLRLELDISEPERKAIVLQQDSFEDELPYIPTTLPMERSAAIPIVPVKQRSTFEIKTCPIDRPRSTTPINPSCLEEYCEEVMGSFNVESVTKTIEKLKISLPRNESFDKTVKVKSPRKKDSNTNWQEFAEKGISIPTRSTPTQASDTPPPLPPKGLQKAWINFEDIPEKRKAPKRIQTIPSRGYIEVPESVLQESVVYNYVNPDECKCECHEINAKERERRNESVHMPVQEDELPLLEDDNAEEDKNGPDSCERMKLDVTVADCRSVISDSSADLSASIDPQDVSGGDVSLKTPFTSDLGVSSNRSSIVSQDENHSPESPNAFPKIS
ncbi:hypothetical protein NQ317_003576 [Molorchus minor]|uniref:Uncharacterized protein n=1 Tax=Molorchus minor TaxID=1323400 RepID=A0ABQ9JDJ5_9CUCU|nr:hypothetical protein NQ317_003576 [Molorchus minor]